MPKINQFIKKLIITLPRSLPTEKRDHCFNEIKEDLIRTFEFDIGFFTEIHLSSKSSNDEYAEAIIEGYEVIGKQNGYEPSAEAKELLKSYSNQVNCYLKEHYFNQNHS